MSDFLPEPPALVALTIAGSDSGGGAGIQADLRTFGAFGVHGTSALTCVTAQNLSGVDAVTPIPADEVKTQIRTVRQGFQVNAAKTGMLFSEAIIRAVAETVSDRGFPILVVDPVMAAASGARLLEPEAETAYREVLLPRAALITPNLDEASVLCERPIRDEQDMAAAAAGLGNRYQCAVLVKGGHLPGDPVDILWHEGKLERWTSPRVDGVLTHGCGCVLSAAITALLARGEGLVAAVTGARGFLNASLLAPQRISADERIMGVPGGYSV